MTAVLRRSRFGGRSLALELQGQFRAVDGGVSALISEPHAGIAPPALQALGMVRAAGEILGDGGLVTITDLLIEALESLRDTPIALPSAGEDLTSLAGGLREYVSVLSAGDDTRPLLARTWASFQAIRERCAARETPADPDPPAGRDDGPRAGGPDPLRHLAGVYGEHAAGVIECHDASELVILRDDAQALRRVAEQARMTSVALAIGAIEALLDAHLEHDRPLTATGLELITVSRNLIPAMIEAPVGTRYYELAVDGIWRRVAALIDGLLDPLLDTIDEPTGPAAGPSVQRTGFDETEASAVCASTSRSILDAFLHECRDRVQTLRSSAVELQADPDRAEPLRAVMRALHSLKGAATIAQVDAVRDCCHRVEDQISELARFDDARRASLATEVLLAADAIEELAAQAELDAGLDLDEQDDRSEPDVLIDVRQLPGAVDAIQDLADRQLAFEQRLLRLQSACSDIGLHAECMRRSNRWLSGPHGDTLGAAEETRYLPVADLGELGHDLTELAAEIEQASGELGRVREGLDALIEQQMVLRTSLTHEINSRHEGTFGDLVPRLRHATAIMAAERRRLVESVFEGEDVNFDTSDLDVLAEVLPHLIRNAIDHGIEPPDERLECDKPAHGQLFVRAAWDARGRSVEVFDDGAGIDSARVVERARELGLSFELDGPAADPVQLVFMPGLSLRDSVDMGSGRGIGLDIVRAAVQRRGGSVLITSERGIGTSVYLTLPDVLIRAESLRADWPSPRVPAASGNVTVEAAEPNESEDVTAAWSQFGGQQGAIARWPERRNRVALVVDDSVSVRRVLGRALQRRGWETIQARDGVEALELFEAEMPDVVVTDIEMPRMDGFALMRELRSHPTSAGVPLVAMVSRTVNDHESEMAEMCASGCLVKPFQEDDLFALLDRLVQPSTEA